MELLKNFLPPIHKEGFYFVVVFAAITMLMSMASPIFGWTGSILTVWCIYFFRDPKRVTPVGDNLVISPADGLVQKIASAKAPAELELDEEDYTRVSIFLSVFDVHVNRIPVTGKVTKLQYVPGKFFNASLDKASEHNERQLIVMETKSGSKQLIFSQIAGLIARRILCEIEEGTEAKAGERFGIIRFGSRMDIYLPKGVNPKVIEGQSVIGGETVIADLLASYEVAKGEVR